MTSLLEYHVSVRPSISALVLALSLVAMPFLASGSHAQINGAPTSVTSPGFGGRAVNGPPASVTSLGPRGYAPNAVVPFPNSANRFRNGVHRRHRNDTPWLYAYPVPYAVDNGQEYDDSAESDNDPNYQGGPTVFDRRGAGARSYVPPLRDAVGPHSAQAVDDPAADSESTQDPTLLVFKDGRQVEIGNYAVVGQTLFDLSPGHTRKIALADLDLEATRKQNDEHGIVFQLPPSLQAN